ncbi:MAG: nucleoside-triphosphatase [Thermoflexales bacterium]
MTNNAAHALPLYALTGPRGAGKTTFCRRLIDLARAAGRDVAGVTSPAVVEQDMRIGFDVEAIRSEERRIFGRATPAAGLEIALGRWFFSPTTLAWGNHVLSTSCPCDALIVDEIGPLELLRDEGWTAALDVLRAGDYRIALVVVRPELLDAARAALPIAQCFDVQNDHDKNQLVALFTR